MNSIYYYQEPYFLCYISYSTQKNNNTILCSTLGLFGMECYCIVYQIPYLILDGKEKMTCPGMIVAPLSLCLLNDIMLSRLLLASYFAKMLLKQSFRKFLYIYLFLVCWVCCCLGFSLAATLRLLLWRMGSGAQGLQ